MKGHHGGGAARIEVCEHCCERDLRDNMVTPCQCHKKYEDCGWWHLDCIEDHLRRMDVQDTTMYVHGARAVQPRGLKAWRP